MKIKIDSSITEIYRIDAQKRVVLPLFSSGVSAGFPSPADDYIERKLDINELLIPHPAATFFVRVSGDSMINASINNDDILVVDRSLEAVDGKIIIAIVDGEMTVKRLYKKGNVYRLLAENPEYSPLEIGEDCVCEVWGVATSVIHQL